MKRSPAFLSVEQLVAVHDRMILEFGGRPGIRDRGLIESAAAMPGAGFDGRLLHRGIAAMAGAYLFHLCRNHPFVDGNKRTALAAAELFVRLNGHQLTATDAELEGLTLGVADGSIAKPQTLAFFRKHVERA